MNYNRIEEAANEISGARAILNCIAASVNASPKPSDESLEQAIMAVEAALEKTEQKLEAACKDLLEEEKDV